MPSFVTDFIRLPLFPIVILALIGILYWRGFLSMRNAKKERAASNAPGATKPGEKPKTP